MKRNPKINSVSFAIHSCLCGDIATSGNCAALAATPVKHAEYETLLKVSQTLK